MFNKLLARSFEEVLFVLYEKFNDFVAFLWFLPVKTVWVILSQNGKRVINSILQEYVRAFRFKTIIFHINYINKKSN